MKLVVEQSIGYMFKVLKSGQKIRAYKDEFNAIKHGDYGTFLKLVQGPQPYIIKWNNGIISDESQNPNFDCDFEGLCKSCPSLKLFYEKCLLAYKVEIDDDIHDDIYHKVVTFEIAIRMHSNNCNLLGKEKKYDLEEVINELCAYKSMSRLEVKNIQKARRFVNMIKHFKQQFPSWPEGINHFLAGFAVLEKYRILIA